MNGVERTLYSVAIGALAATALVCVVFAASLYAASGRIETVDVFATRIVDWTPWLLVAAIATTLLFGAYLGRGRWAWLALVALALCEAVAAFAAFYTASQPSLASTLATIALPIAVASALTAVAVAAPSRHGGRAALLGGTGWPLICAVVIGVAAVLKIQHVDLWSATADQARSGDATGLLTPFHIVPELRFRPFFALLRAVPDKLGGVGLMAAGALVWLLTPWLDRGAGRPLWRRPGAFVATALALSAFAVLGWLGGVSPEPWVDWSARAAAATYFAAWFVVLPLLSARDRSPSAGIDLM